MALSSAIVNDDGAVFVLLVLMNNQHFFYFAGRALAFRPEFSIIPPRRIFVNRQSTQRSGVKNPEIYALLHIDFLIKLLYNKYIKKRK